MDVNYNICLFFSLPLEFDVNANASNEEADMGLNELFADLPSNLDHTRSYQSASRRSLRRRCSKKVPETLDRQKRRSERCRYH